MNGGAKYREYENSLLKRCWLTDKKGCIKALKASTTMQKLLHYILSQESKLVGYKIKWSWALYDKEIKLVYLFAKK